MKVVDTEKRNQHLEEIIKGAIETFELESTVRDFIREKLIAAYHPDKEEIKMYIEEQIKEIAKSEIVIDAVLEKLVRKIVEEKIKELAEDFKREIKDKILETIGRDLDDY